MLPLLEEISADRTQKMLRNADDDCWGWNDFTLRSMDAASFSINKPFLISDCVVLCYQMHVWLQKSSWNRRSVSWGILWLAPAGNHNRSPRLRDCSVENVNRKRNMNWKSRSLTSRRRNTLGIPPRQGIACFHNQGEIFSVFYLRDEQQQNKQRTPDATRPERCHCNCVELKRARVRLRRVHWRCVLMIAEIVAVTLLYGNDSAFT